MPQDTQTQSLNAAIGRMQAAEARLTAQGDATADPAVLADIQAQFAKIDAALSDAFRAQVIADDAAFAAAAAALRTQAQTLKDQAVQIGAVCADAAEGAKVTGDILQAVTFLLAL